MNEKISYKNNDIFKIMVEKLDFFKKIIQKTIKSQDYYKYLGVIEGTDYNNSLLNLELLYNKCLTLQNKIDSIEDTTKLYNEENIKLIPLNNCEPVISNINNIEVNDTIKDLINSLQDINDGLFLLFKTKGTDNLEDLLLIIFGKNYISQLKELEKYKLLNLHFKPISFKIMYYNEKNNNKNKKNEIINKKNEIVDENIKKYINKKTLDCYDISRETTNFAIKLNGLKILFKNEHDKKLIIISGIIDNIIFDLYDNNYINNILNDINFNIPQDDKFKNNDFKNFMKCLSLRDILVFSKEDIYNRFNGYINQVNMMKQLPISQVVREFINDNIYIQRTKIIQLLIKSDNPEHQYLCYLLYDLLSNDDKSIADTKEQTLIYDSLPWEFKKLFKTAMKTTIEYTSKLRNSNTKNIELEQQICLMKVDDNVKEKAMIKLKEVKAKNEDGGLKARQYLDGLLKIPFGIYRYEPILKLMKENTVLFKQFITDLINTNQNIDLVTNKIENKKIYTPMEIYKYKQFIKDEYLPLLVKNQQNYIIEKLTSGKRDNLINNINNINKHIIKELNIKTTKLLHSGKKNTFLKNEIKQFINSYIFNNEKQNNNIKDAFITLFNLNDTINIDKITHQLDNIHLKWDNINKNIASVRNILDSAVYGHNKAKRQIERIIGQWMTGSQSGYCFGFEGPPGVGKTSLAKKGLAKCLTDENGVSRPFGFIAIGGSSNSSTLDGHNYTYVGSTWGRIVDILIESKCMNPIIFIDELDKISKTEQGKEIIGILTHLVDPTQNDSFQDKYFNGIDIDLSKALFIFSYNDASLLDRILLDRIHRIKFSSQSTEQKIIITRDYILPEIYEKLNMIDMIHINDDVIKYIIDYYTYESGVRKLKEVLFEIISEINLEILNNQLDNFQIPYNINIENIKNKYLKHRDEVSIKKIHTTPEVGIINGLWANNIGQGGIIPIQCSLYPSSSLLDFKLTGMQGDVMKESMNVAKTLAYKLTPKERQKKLIIDFKETQLQGVHIHCPEGATPKDGPSAGTAITCCIYSLLNNLKINNTIAITGEINLQGFVTAIGGLDLKILGGIRAGIKHFIFPKENKKDFDKFFHKYEKNELIKDIIFTQVENIKEVIDIVFE